MTTKEARDVLLELRPERPRKTDARRLQQAIDIAISTMDSYENLLKAISVDIRGISK